TLHSLGVAHGNIWFDSMCLFRPTFSSPLRLKLAGFEKCQFGKKATVRRKLKDSVAIGSVLYQAITG
ncbi:MAG: hypothetical protein V2I33_26060, partial [Kangiellaceae bacterium]|nr:hypothetical protein [Kangiellaceae bacterium]